MEIHLIRRLPLALVSRVVGWATRRHWPTPLLRAALRRYVAHYRVDVAEAELPLSGYPTVEAFFTRRLRAGVRPVADATVVAPCDGAAHGPVPIREGTLLPAKGHAYRLVELLGPLRDWGPRFDGGRCLTLYLSPRDYHRYHAPAAMTLTRYAHIPGRRWPVNGWAVRRVPGLFVENERVVAVGKADAGWPVALVFVAALNVGHIHLHGVNLGSDAHIPTVAERPWRLAPGEEMGYFSLGSTILLLLPKEAPGLRPMDPGEAIRVGSALAPWPLERRAPPPQAPPPP